MFSDILSEIPSNYFEYDVARFCENHRIFLGVFIPGEPKHFKSESSGRFSKASRTAGSQNITEIYQNKFNNK